MLADASALWPSDASLVKWGWWAQRRRVGEALTQGPHGGHQACVPADPPLRFPSVQGGWQHSSETAKELELEDLGFLPQGSCYLRLCV